MFDQIFRLGNFMVEAFLHIWPYLVVTIPLAIAVQMSGASKFIKRAFQARPLTAILLATFVGAFSPFCSCGIIPIIASVLIAGVPLAPVMSFWIASPSMDPEIFFLSVGMIGWKLAVWRLTATLVMSLSAGLITHWVMKRGWLGQQILRTRKSAQAQSTFDLIKKGWGGLKNSLVAVQSTKYAIPAVSPPVCAACSVNVTSVKNEQIRLNPEIETILYSKGLADQTQSCDSDDRVETFRGRLFKETLGAIWMVAKFMALAFLLEGFITLYIPREWISTALGRQNPLAIITAAVLGVPMYTSSLTALPLISGLLTQGMNSAAALAFLIAGPTTTLPVMAAVWPLVSRPVFFLYVTSVLMGAAGAGYFYEAIILLKNGLAF